MLDQRTDVVMINFMYKVIFLLAPELCTSLTMSGEKGEIQGPRGWGWSLGQGRDALERSAAAKPVRRRFVGSRNL